MKTTIGYVIASIILASAVGCGTTGRNADTSSTKLRMAKLEKENGEIKQLLTTLVAQQQQKKEEDTDTDASEKPGDAAKPPAAPALPVTSGPVVGNIVHPSVAGYPCYMSAGDPSFGDPNWAVLTNDSRVGDQVSALDGEAVQADGVTQGSGRPVIVMMPGRVPGSWVKRFIGVGALTALPVGAKCWLNLVDRMDGNGAVMVHELHASFFRLATNPVNPMTRVAVRQAVLKHPMTLIPPAFGHAGHVTEWFELQ